MIILTLKLNQENQIFFFLRKQIKIAKFTKITCNQRTSIDSSRKIFLIMFHYIYLYSFLTYYLSSIII